MTPTSIRQWLLAFVVSGCVLAAVAVATRNTIRVQQLAKQNHTLAAQGLHLAQEIQNQRVQSLLDDCRSSNQKYETTIGAIAAANHGNVPPTVQLIIADLVPHHTNCMAYVRSKVPGA